MISSIVLGGSNSDLLAKKIARKANASYSKVITRNFPDGETYVRINAPLKGKRVIYVQSMHPKPN